MNTITKLDKNNHRNIMKNILVDIYSSFELSTSLVFKWGTASYFFYDLDRFSTDLDFDLLIENNSISEDIVLEKINNILSKYWEVKRSYNKRYTIFSLLSYGTIDYNIKVEISKRGISWEYENISWFGTSVLVMTEKSIFTSKLHTLLNRTSLANRDIYDVYFFFKKNTQFDIELLEQKTGKTYIEYFKELIKFLENIPKNHSILWWLWEVLNDEKHKSFVKEKLVVELINILQFKIKFTD